MIVYSVVYYNRMEIEAAKEGILIDKTQGGTNHWVKTPVPPVTKTAEAEEKK